MAEVVITALIAGSVALNAAGLAASVLRSSSVGDWWWMEWRRRHRIGFARTDDNMKMFYRYCKFFQIHLANRKFKSNSVLRDIPGKAHIVFRHTTESKEEEEVFHLPDIPFEMEFFAEDDNRRLQFFVYPIVPSPGIISGWAFWSNPYWFQDQFEASKKFIPTQASHSGDRLEQFFEREVEKNFANNPEHFQFSETIPSTPPELLAPHPQKPVLEDDFEKPDLGDGFEMLPARIFNFKK